MILPPNDFAILFNYLLLTFRGLKKMRYTFKHLPACCPSNKTLDTIVLFKRYGRIDIPAISTWDIGKSSIYFSMTVKEAVIEKLKSLPDDIGAQEIRERLDFILGVQSAMESMDRGEGVPKDKVRSMVKQWATK